MKHILILILSFVALTTVAQDETTQTLSTSYTLEKEVDGIDKKDIKWSEVYDLAIINIKDCKTEKHRVATIKSYLSILPLVWKWKLLNYSDKYYPQYRWIIRH